MSNACAAGAPIGRYVRAARALIPAALYAVGFCLFFRVQILSGLDRAFGDRGDARLIAFLHEHLYRAFRGQGEITSPPFFFDWPNTLGFTDAFLLNVLVYAPLRAVGFDLYHANVLWPMVLSAFGFGFMYLLLRRLSVSIPLAAAGAFLFAFANNLYIKSGHTQHFAAYYLPAIAYLGVVAVQRLENAPIRAYAAVATAAAMGGLLFATGYYVAWFFALQAAIFLLALSGFGWPHSRAWLFRNRARVAGLLLLGGVVGAAALVPFAIIYGPVLSLGLSRSVRDYLYYAPEVSQLLNVGLTNALWSDLVRASGLIAKSRLAHGEFSVAITPVLLLATLASGACALACRRFWDRDDIRRPVVAASACVCVLFILLIVKINQRSLFEAAYAVIPGATAIRVGYRGMVVANLFAVVATVLTLQRMSEAARGAGGRRGRTVRYAVVSVVCVVLLAEQVNLGFRTDLSRSFELAHLGSIPAAPAGCRAFYVVNEPGRQAYEVHVDAMMLALREGIPTLNGYSGWAPPGWPLHLTDDPRYEEAMLDWAKRRNIGEGLCRLDFDRRLWTLRVQGCVGRGRFE